MDGQKHVENKSGEREVHGKFLLAANSLSQLYAAAEDQQKLAFDAGDRQSLGKLRQWILERQQWITEADIIAYLQNELDYSGGETAFMALQQSQESSSDVITETSASFVPVPYEVESSNNTMLPAAPPSYLREVSCPSGIQPGGYYFQNSSHGPQSINDEVNSEHTVPQIYTLQPEIQDLDMEMHAEGPFQQFHQ